MTNTNNLIEQRLKGITAFDLIDYCAKVFMSHADLEPLTQPKNAASVLSESEHYTPKQVCLKMQISNVTLHRYVKDGLLTKIKINRKKVLYLKDEVHKLLLAKNVA